jgi:hypothetical protein
MWRSMVGRHVRKDAEGSIRRLYSVTIQEFIWCDRGKPINSQAEHRVSTQSFESLPDVQKDGKLYV